MEVSALSWTLASIVIVLQVALLAWLSTGVLIDAIPLLDWRSEAAVKVVSCLVFSALTWARQAGEMSRAAL